jgi:hypothetical protein
MSDSSDTSTNEKQIIPGCNNDFNSVLTALTDPPARKNIDPTIVSTLYQQGYSSTQICKALKISKATVFYHLNNIREDKEINRFFVKNRAEVLQNTQRRLLTSISDEEIKKTPVGSRILGFAQLYDKERLENNQSTHNSAHIIGIDPVLRQGLSGLSGILDAAVGADAGQVRDSDSNLGTQSLQDQDRDDNISEDAQPSNIVEDNS